MVSSPQLQPGERITHPEFGQGVVLDAARDGYLRAFFSVGERRVPVTAVRLELSRTERILRSVEGTEDRARKAWLSYEAHVLPLMESASALTSARIDLLPHQVVLTHRIATASPRRFLIADAVGLGKTIEPALVLRELASRGASVYPQRSAAPVLRVHPMGKRRVCWLMMVARVLHHDRRIRPILGRIAGPELGRFAEGDRTASISQHAPTFRSAGSFGSHPT